MDWIWHEAVFRITHGQRPEGMIRRELPGREVQEVGVPAVQCVSGAIFARRPVHRFLRYVYGSQKYDGAGGPAQYVIAGLAASEHGGPAVDFRDIGVPDHQ